MTGRRVLGPAEARIMGVAGVALLALGLLGLDLAAGHRGAAGRDRALAGGEPARPRPDAFTVNG